MSYYWAVPGSSVAPTTSSVMDNHSSLHQERAYLLSALAAEESRVEQLTFSLERTRKKLAAAEHAENPIEAIAGYKKATTSLVRKLSRSQKSQKAMVSNLAAATAGMQMIEQHQWRKAQFEYSQRAQLPVNGMALNMQNLTLVSPMTPGYSFDSGTPVSPFTPALVSPMPFMPVLPPVMLAAAAYQMHWTPTYQGTCGSLLYPPLYEQHFAMPQELNGPSMQDMTYPSPDGESWWAEGDDKPPQQGSRLRTMSLPAVQHRTGCARSGTDAGIEEDESINPKPRAKSARRFSLIGVASSGIRLEESIE